METTGASLQLIGPRIMEAEYNYTCPNCSGACTLPLSLTNQNVICPSCSGEFFATPPDISPASSCDFQPPFRLPAKLPFLKHGRRDLLKWRIQELLAANRGSLDQACEDELNKNAIALGLSADD